MTKTQQELITDFNLKEDLVPVTNSDGKQINKLIGWSKAVHMIPYGGRMSVSDDFKRLKLQLWKTSYSDNELFLSFTTSDIDIFRKFIDMIKECI